MDTVGLVAATLARAGVRHVWGMPGGDSLPLVDALAAVGVPLYLVRDETSAAFAADADAALGGGYGACLATLGPGITNLTTGVAGALLDRAPVLALTSRYRSDRHGAYTHMILDQEALMKAVGKHHVRLTAAGAAEELRRALSVARAPRPGPAWIEIPTEVASEPALAALVTAPPPPAATPVPQALARTLRRWERPVILVGHAGRRAPVADLARALAAPVLTTYKAKGAIPEGQGWSAGAVGLSPPIDALHQELVGRADGLLLIGWDPVELRDHWLPGWGPEPEVVVLDEAEPTDLPCRIDAVHVGRLPVAVASLADGGTGASTWSADAIALHRGRWQALLAETTFGPATAVRAVQRGARPDTVVTLDVGAHRITASNAWICDRPDQLLQSNGFSSMGYGLPAALSAAANGRPAVAIVGDMGLQMTLGELALAAEERWDLTVVVFVDSSLSLIELKQERRGRPPRGVRFGNPDWPAVAEAFGGTGVRVDDADALAGAVRRAHGLTLVAAHIDPLPYRRQM